MLGFFVCLFLFLPRKKTKILNLKEANLLLGAKWTCKRTPPNGTLHHASDWVLLVDFNSNYCLPVPTALTQLRTDITILSDHSKKVILIELTCLCEENSKSWHGTKIKKYLALKTIIECKGWCMKLFEVEVGARGYCSKSFLCCLKKLGFSNKLIRSTIKNLSKSCMECCFSI